MPETLKQDVETNQQNIDSPENKEYSKYLASIRLDEDKTPKATYSTVKKLKNGVTININGHDINSYLSVQIPHRDPNVIQWKEYTVIATADKIFDVNTETGEITGESKKFSLNNGKISVNGFKPTNIDTNTTNGNNNKEGENNNGEDFSSENSSGENTNNGENLNNSEGSNNSSNEGDLPESLIIARENFGSIKTPEDVSNDMLNDMIEFDENIRSSENIDDDIQIIFSKLNRYKIPIETQNEIISQYKEIMKSEPYSSGIDTFESYLKDELGLKERTIQAIISDI